MPRMVFFAIIFVFWSSEAFAQSACSTEALRAAAADYPAELRECFDNNHRHASCPLYCSYESRATTERRTYWSTCVAPHIYEGVGSSDRSAVPESDDVLRARVQEAARKRRAALENRGLQNLDPRALSYMSFMNYCCDMGFTDSRCSARAEEDSPRIRAASIYCEAQRRPGAGGTLGFADDRTRIRCSQYFSYTTDEVMGWLRGLAGGGQRTGQTGTQVDDSDRARVRETSPGTRHGTSGGEAPVRMDRAR